MMPTLQEHLKPYYDAGASADEIASATSAWNMGMASQAKAREQYQQGDALAGLVAGAFFGGPVGAVTGGVIGYLGGGAAYGKF